MKKLLALAICLGTFLTLPAFVVAAFPDRNIVLVVPFSPGGGFDSISRAIARSMKKYTPKGVDVIVKNVIGAGGLNGTVFLYRSKPNGYMIGHLYSGQLPTQMFRGGKSVGYDMQKFTWLAQVGRDPSRRSVRMIEEALLFEIRDVLDADGATATGEIDHLDLSFIPSLVPSLAMVKGSVSGRGQMTGSLHDPQFAAHVEFHETSFQVKGIYQTFLLTRKLTELTKT